MKHTESMKLPKHPRGRPVKYPMPDPISDTPDNVLKTVFAGPPKKEWRYLKYRKSARR